MIIMYHYVRDLQHTRYPRIKALQLSAFEGQLEYLARHHTFVSDRDVLEAWKGGRPLAKGAVLLSFDDGLSDHFEVVFPLLDRKGIPACFFPTARAVLEHRVLDVHKIHFILASAPGSPELAQALERELEAARVSHGLAQVAEYRHRVMGDHRYDDPDTVFVKRILQRELPDPLRGEIVDRLFERYVGIEDSVFARELYLNVEQMRTLVRHGMSVGGHGYRHLWMDRLGEADRQEEILRSRELVRVAGGNPDAWSLCYPYGGQDAELRARLPAHGCVLGLGTEVALASPDRHDVLNLPRLDTNDIPCVPAAPPSRWTSESLDGGNRA
jgi:peptidoglycan/xylan/chitin deacetylase (PgdA/CDA1 family)